jgi:hypothetical protein
MSRPAATLDELRDLSARSRRAQGTGFAAMLALLALIPALALILAAAPNWFSWATVAALGIGGLLFVRYAFVAGQERGAFRKVLKRVKEDRTHRVLIPEERAEPEKRAERAESEKVEIRPRSGR